MAEVFISYDRDDTKLVTKIVDGLQAEAIPFWWDKNLKQGENFSVRIEEKIEQVKHVLVTWSSRAKQSVYVRGEALEALDRGKLIQVVLDETRLPVPFNAIQATFLNGWTGDLTDPRWGALVETIRPSSESAGQAVAAGQELSDRDILNIGVSRTQMISLWLIPLLLLLLMGAGGGLVLIDKFHPERVPQIETIFVGTAVFIVTLILFFLITMTRLLASTFRRKR